MSKIEKDNSVFVLYKILKKLKIKVTRTAIRFYLNDHPYFPTLKSVCDVLKNLNIEHYPIKLELSEIKDLEFPFLAHLNISGGQLAYVNKIHDDKVEYFLNNTKKQTEDFDVFVKDLSGSVILIEPNQKVSEPNYRQNRQNEILAKNFLPLSITTILLFSIYNFIPNIQSAFFYQPIFIELLVIVILGIIATVFLVMHEFKIHSSIGDKLCGFSSKTDCDSILSSNASKLFGNINWADVGVIYFVGLFVYLLNTNSLKSLSYIAILSAFSLPYPIFSIYYQGVKLKKWCPFCLLVQILLVAEFFVLIPVFNNLFFSSFDFLYMVIAFLIPAVIWIQYKTLKEKNYKGSRLENTLQKFRHNPEIFKSLLTSTRREEFYSSKKSILLGNPDAPITVTAFLSLYCAPCAEAFNRLKSLIETCSEIKLNLIFSVYHDEETQKLINTIYYRYAINGADDIISFLNNWYTTPKQNRNSLYESEMIPEEYNVAQKIAEINNNQFNEYKISGTPSIFVNGFKFPKQYDYYDLRYYIDDIKQLSMESKRQKACSNCN